MPFEIGPGLISMLSSTTSSTGVVYPTGMMPTADLPSYGSTTTYENLWEENILYDPRTEEFSWSPYGTLGGGIPGPFGITEGYNIFGSTPAAEEPTPGGGIITPPGPSGPAPQEDIEWILGDYDVGGQGPDWWRPFTVKNKEHFSNPAVAATLMMNALIGSGSLSDEDARSMAKQLYATWGGQTADNPWDLYSTKFGDRPDYMGTPTMQGTFDPRISQEQMHLGQTGPGVIDKDWRFSRDRSQQALDALSMMREATVGGNVQDFGPGYQYLQEIAGTLGEAGDGTTRAQRLQILGALDPMMAMSKSGELAGYSAGAQMLASPFWTNMPPQVSRTQAGNYQFGRQSKHLFF